MNAKKDISIKKDWTVAFLSALGFFGLLKLAGWVDNNFDFSAIFNLVDFYTVAVKVAVASALAWTVKKIIFTNTLGKDYGKVFDSAWNNQSDSDKVKWILICFLAIFISVMFNF